jgi:hypothetical protein
MLALDPGTRVSGWVVFDGRRVVLSGTDPNERVLAMLEGDLDCAPPDVLAVERFEARGMAIGDDSVRTVLWTGRFWQAWRDPDAVRLVKRSEVKLALCGTSRAKDANIRAALIDLFGGKEEAIGRKKTPGPLYGVSGHAWAALSVAVIAWERT